MQKATGTMVLPAIIAAITPAAGVAAIVTASSFALTVTVVIVVAAAGARGALGLEALVAIDGAIFARGKGDQG